jgi:hypothetical protein
MYTHSARTELAKKKKETKMKPSSLTHTHTYVHTYTHIRTHIHTRTHTPHAYVQHTKYIQSPKE